MFLGNETGAVKGFIAERIRTGRRAARNAAKGGFTHVHCHDPLLAYVYQRFRWFYGATSCWGYSLSAYGRFVKKRIGIQANEKVFRYLESWEMKAADNARWVMVQTRKGMEQMRQDLGFETIPARWYVVGNPVTKYYGDRTGTRRKLGIGDEQKPFSRWPADTHEPFDRSCRLCHYFPSIFIFCKFWVRGRAKKVIKAG